VASLRGARYRAALVLTMLLALVAGQVEASAAAGWSIVPSPNPLAPQAQLTATSCTSPSACTSVGLAVDGAGAIVALAERRDGTAWTVQSTPMPADGIASEFLGVSCSSATACTAIGDYTNSAHTRLTLAEAWNGTTWAVQATPNPSTLTYASAVLAAVSCTSATACTAVGYSAVISSTAMAEGWDGTSWHLESTAKLTGSKFSNLAGISCTSATTCIAVGFYDDITGTRATLAERWNGSTWARQQMLTSLTGGELFGVSCTSATSCIAVGTKGSTTLAERWNGTLWTGQTTVNPTGALSSSLAAVSCTSATACTAVGSYSVNTTTQPLAERWNGSAWVLQSAPLPSIAIDGQLLGVGCGSATSCIASGLYLDSHDLVYALAEPWNGTVWTVGTAITTQGALPALFDAVACTSVSACIAVGTTTDVTGANLALAEQWDGTAWSIQSIPSPAGSSFTQLRSIACATATSCMTVGELFDSQGFPIAVVEQWDGSAWHIESLPFPASAQSDSLAGVACGSAASCIAVGVSVDSAGTSHMLALAWDGTAWTQQSVPPPAGAQFVFLASVSCTDASTCTAVGEYVDAAGTTRPLAERWDGTAWAVQPTPMPSGAQSAELSGVSCAAATACIAVGDDKDASGRMAPVAERWDGVAWTAQSIPSAGATGSRLNGVSCSGATSCTAVGDQADASSHTFPLAESWGGSTWVVQPTPTPLGSLLTRLLGVSCLSNTACFASGLTVNSAGYDVSLIERYSA